MIWTISHSNIFFGVTFLLFSQSKINMISICISVILNLWPALNNKDTFPHVHATFNILAMQFLLPKPRKMFSRHQFFLVISLQTSKIHGQNLIRNRQSSWFFVLPKGLEALRQRLFRWPNQPGGWVILKTLSYYKIRWVYITINFARRSDWKSTSWMFEGCVLALPSMVLCWMNAWFPSWPHWRIGLRNPLQQFHPILSVSHNVQSWSVIWMVCLKPWLCHKWNNTKHKNLKRNRGKETM